uniref:Uncharacterized protein n=1 Tax=Hemiselmis andersenii TaxID=464988 RepID=A0A7S0THY6_HEMAN
MFLLLLLLLLLLFLLLLFLLLLLCLRCNHHCHCPEEDALHRQMHAIDKRKAALNEEILTLHKMIKRYAALEQGRYEGKDAEEVASELQRAQERREALVAIMRDLAQQHPDVESDLAPILERHPLPGQ